MHTTSLQGCTHLQEAVQQIQKLINENTFVNKETFVDKDIESGNVLLRARQNDMSIDEMYGIYKQMFASSGVFPDSDINYEFVKLQNRNRDNIETNTPTEIVDVNNNTPSVASAYMEENAAGPIHCRQQPSTLRTCFDETTREMFVEMCGYYYPIDMPGVNISDDSETFGFNESSTRQEQTQYYEMNRCQSKTTNTQSGPEHQAESQRNKNAYSPEHDSVSSSPKSFLDLDNNDLISSHHSRSSANSSGCSRHVETPENLQPVTDELSVSIKKEPGSPPSYPYTYSMSSPSTMKQTGTPYASPISSEYSGKFAMYLYDDMAQMDNGLDTQRQIITSAQTFSDYKGNVTTCCKHNNACNTVYRTKTRLCSGDSLTECIRTSNTSLSTVKHSDIYQDLPVSTTSVHGLYQTESRPVSRQQPETGFYNQHQTRIQSPSMTSRTESQSMTSSQSPMPSDSDIETHTECNEPFDYDPEIKSLSCPETSEFDHLRGYPLQSKADDNPQKISSYYESLNARSSARDIKVTSSDVKLATKKLKRGCRLWEFIRNLLLDPSTNPSHIRWENRAEGTFRLVQSKSIARIWGMQKDNEKMNYEKLSRAMRYYYKRQVFQPVIGKRLVYRFGPRATGWKEQETGNNNKLIPGKN